MMLFGCAYYPWARASPRSGPVRYLFLLNPLVFMSEAMRLAVTPEVPHMPTPLLLFGLLGWLLVFTAGRQALVREADDSLASPGGGAGPFSRAHFGPAMTPTPTRNARTVSNAFSSCSSVKPP